MANKPKELYTIKETADILGVSVQAVYKTLKANDTYYQPFIVVKGKVRHITKEGLAKLKGKTHSQAKNSKEITFKNQLIQQQQAQLEQLHIENKELQEENKDLLRQLTEEKERTLQTILRSQQVIETKAEATTQQEQREEEPSNQEPQEEQKPSKWKRIINIIKE